MIRRTWSPSEWIVTIRLTAESNGSSAMRVDVARTVSTSTPLLRANVTSAASVGSPTATPLATSASLHRTAAVRADASGGRSLPVAAISPSVS